MKPSRISSGNIQIAKSEIGYSYSTIKITKSRINKGLLAVPASLLVKFPKEKRKITVFLDDEEKPYLKSFTPYNSSSQECRIIGLTNWFVKNKIQDQDEIVVQFLDENEGIYRLIKEEKFIEQIKILENKLLNSNKEEDSEKYFEDLSLKVNKSKKRNRCCRILEIR